MVILDLHFFLKSWENVLFKFGSERVSDQRKHETDTSLASLSSVFAFGFILVMRVFASCILFVYTLCIENVSNDLMRTVFCLRPGGFASVNEACDETAAALEPILSRGSAHNW